MTKRRMAVKSVPRVRCAAPLKRRECPDSLMSHMPQTMASRYVPVVDVDNTMQTEMNIA